MITNLFSVFDPSSRLRISLNWIIIGLSLFIIPIGKWRVSSRRVKLTQEILESFNKEIYPILNPRGKVSIVIFSTLFFFVIVSNLLGLLPYVFTRTRHLAVTLRVALPLWLGYFSYGWANGPKWILAHLLPQGTPLLLIPFIVVIERVRRIIRPITLAVRLIANIVAGHLLLTLARNAVQFSVWLSPVTIVITQVALVILEIAVAVIQAYVLVILRVLYSREV